jgi:hypothetical protein
MGFFNVFYGFFQSATGKADILVVRKMGLKPRASNTAWLYACSSGKVINHSKNLAVERQSAEQEKIESKRFYCIFRP